MFGEKPRQVTRPDPEPLRQLIDIAAVERSVLD